MLTPQNTCLIIIDIQEKLLPVMAEPWRIVKNTGSLIHIAKALDIPVLWCQQVPTALGPTVEELSSLLEDIEPVEKSCFSCCGEKRFLARLDEVNAKTAVLCGIESHVCVFQTAADLLQKGLDVHVVADATSSRTLENKQIAIDRMRQKGATITSVEMYLFELLRDAKHTNFRELTKLIK